MKTKTEWKSVLPSQGNNLGYWLSKSDGSIWNTTRCDFRWVNCISKYACSYDDSLSLGEGSKIIGDE